MNSLNEVFGRVIATNIRNNLSNAFISETYDNSVDLTIPTFYGDFVFGVFCHYADGDDERPLAGAIDFDSDTEYYDFSQDFSNEERDIIQNILDNHSFKKGQFLTVEERDL